MVLDDEFLDNKTQTILGPRSWSRSSCKSIRTRPNSCSDLVNFFSLKAKRPIDCILAAELSRRMMSWLTSPSKRTHNQLPQIQCFFSCDYNMRTFEFSDTLLTPCRGRGTCHQHGLYLPSDMLNDALTRLFIGGLHSQGLFELSATVSKLFMISF